MCIELLDEADDAPIALIERDLQSPVGQILTP